MQIRLHTWLGALLLTCWLGLLPAHAQPEHVDPMLRRPAVKVRFADKAFLLGVAKAGSRLVAVGERGIIILSDDGGRSWRQAQVPVSVTLTAVSFPTDMQGWAIGHSGVVLHSADGGNTWRKQLDGDQVAALALHAAQKQAARLGADNPLAKRMLGEANRLVTEGSNKPFFDLYFENDKRGYIVGAYNLAFKTEDGGSTWQYWSDRIDNPRGFHIYSIKAKDSTIYLAGEQGLFLRSSDAGGSFAQFATPYKGSTFTMSILPSGTVVLAGLRGNAYQSGDQGVNWQKIESGSMVSFSGSALTQNGALLLANQAGQLFISADQGLSLRLIAGVELPPVSALVSLDDGAILAVGLRGAARVAKVAAAAPSTPATNGANR